MKLTFDVPEEMAEKIAENIKVALDEYKKKQVWPQEDDPYYYITDDGDILYGIYDGTLPDKDRLQFGNIFKTEEEAEFKLEKLKVFQELEQLADDDQPWDSNCRHYYLEYNYDTNDVELNYCYSLKHTVIYFKSEESAQAAIDEIGKDSLKKYYFYIPEKENE